MQEIEALTDVHVQPPQRPVEQARRRRVEPEVIVLDTVGCARRQAILGPDLGGYQHVSLAGSTHVPVVDGTAQEHRKSSLALEGELLWDLDAGHATSLELTAAVDSTSETIRDADQPGPTFTSTLSFVGERKISVEIE